MTNKEINRRVAELSGWSYFHDEDPEHRHWMKLGHPPSYTDPPDFCGNPHYWAELQRKALIRTWPIDDGNCWRAAFSDCWSSGYYEAPTIGEAVSRAYIACEEARRGG